MVWSSKKGLIFFIRNFPQISNAHSDRERALCGSSWPIEGKISHAIVNFTEIYLTFSLIFKSLIFFSLESCVPRFFFHKSSLYVRFFCHFFSPSCVDKLFQFQYILNILFPLSDFVRFFFLRGLIFRNWRYLVNCIACPSRSRWSPWARPWPSPRPCCRSPRTWRPTYSVSKTTGSPPDRELKVRRKKVFQPVPNRESEHPISPITDMRVETAVSVAWTASSSTLAEQDSMDVMLNPKGR